ncbi:2-oxo-4-hydroxy-4-carboxy-5-ureidoimidazoline decarboxylase [Demetria terragena]|uniref:2-oxo-4-hydroxy-4-carboxy-5-ureidoimidazoline decarboxylase n=1 Tax=Demetria terragena TaxID=63959 RepID=UPI00037B98E5|nr:2-oxo-4-hydroxy-4-carboxy-5-ureidoimidazoline decarboxylase [Demetria terragena]
MTTKLSLEQLNSAESTNLSDVLLACCASPEWVRALLAHRPFATVEDVLADCDRAFAGISDSAIDDALSGHPRIGDRAAGSGADAQWSREEQASVADADADVQTRLRAGNVAYEERFNRVFLIRAAGRSPEDMLAELTRRLDQDDHTERAEVREQLRQITRLRLEGLLTD